MLRFAVLLALVACEPMPNPSADVLAPVVDAEPETRVGVAGDQASPSEAELFDFDADLPEEEEEDAPALSDAQLQAKLLGHALPPDEPEVETPTPVPAAPEATVASAEMMPVQSILQPGQALPGNWGIRLVSTVFDADPPRAILGFPDGREEVVQAGALLPGEGVAVLAIGRNAVQIAEITPAGDHARVESRVISALFPQTATVE